MDKVGVAPLPPEDEDALSEEAGVALIDFPPSLTKEEANLKKMEENGTPALVSEEDSYDGMIIDPTALPSDGDVFLSRLRLSLCLWTHQQKKGVWLKIPSSKASLVPLAIAEGFSYYYAESNYVALTKWLPSSPSTLPPNASHQVGVGAFVVNENREILAVQEKNGVLRGKNIWKLPTGLVNKQEDLSAAAVREVKEETGIDTEFVEIITFRQAHGAAFGKSDLFFICALKPLSFEITKQESEIEEAQWMPLDDFMEQSFFKNREAFVKMLGLCVAHLDGRYKGFKSLLAPLGIGSQSSAEVYGSDLVDSQRH